MTLSASQIADELAAGRLVTIAQASKLIGIHRATLLRFIASGRLKTVAHPIYTRKFRRLIWRKDLDRLRA